MDITVSSLTVKYGKKVILRGIDQTFREGKINILMGSNGCGKTTLVKAVVGQYASSGKIAYVAQDVYGTVGLSVEDVISLGRYDRSRFFTGMTASDRKLIGWAMDLMELGEHKDQIFDTLSGGEKQRCMVARALAQDTEWVILDEPASNLDVRHTQHIMKTFRKLNREQGKSFLIVVHDVNTAAAYGDLFVMMKDGVVIRTAEELTAQDLSELYDSSFVSAKTGSGRPVFIAE